jgi:prefoldin subunit 5
MIREAIQKLNTEKDGLLGAILALQDEIVEKKQGIKEIDSKIKRLEKLDTQVNDIIKEEK